MDEQEQYASLLDVCDETSSSLNNTTFHSLNNTGITQSVLENNGLNQDLSNPVRLLDFQRMMIDQNNVVIALKLSEYEKALAERDYKVKSLYTNMMNSQNNNYVLNNQYKNIIERTNSVNDSCIRLNTSFTNICERLNGLGETIDNARNRQKDVMTLVDQTTSTFQEKILSISDTIDESLKQVTMENIRTKQDLEMLQNKYSLEMVAFKTNLQECTNEIEYLKKENNILLEKLNDANIKLNYEKEIVLNLNQHFETELREMEGQNLLLINQNKSTNEKYEEIRTKNQTLNDELNVLKTALNENKKQLDMQSNIIKEHSELCDNLKIFEELNDKLKNDNFTLKEQNEYLEQMNTNLVENISSIKLSQHEMQEETENKFKDMCENYDNLLKMQDERLKDKTDELALQKEKEIKNQTEVIELKEEIETSNKKIAGLQEELQTNNVLIPELQNKIDDLNKNLNNTYQTLRDSTKELAKEKNKLEKDRNELKNQSKEHLSQIEKLTANNIKYKSKAKQLYVEVMRLKYQYSRSKPKQQLQTIDTIEILSDEDNIDNDASTVEFNDQDVSNMDISMHSTSNIPFKKSNLSSSKRNSSPLCHIGSSKVKKHITSARVAASHKKIVYNQNVNDSVDFDSSASPQQIVSNMNNEGNKSQIKSTLNTATKQKFKIPADIQVFQNNFKSTNKPNRTKPNSPVIFTAPSPKFQT